MFDIGSTELLLIAVVALLVIGPKDLPRVLNTVGKWISKARAMTGHIRSGIETMAREAELEDMEKQWAEHNAKIVADHPDQPPEMMPLASAPDGGEETVAAQATAGGAEGTTVVTPAVLPDAAPDVPPEPRLL